MHISQIIAGVDEEISRLQRARQILAGGSGGSIASAYLENKSRKKRVLSAEARAKIAAAQKRRWAKQKRAA